MNMDVFNLQVKDCTRTAYDYLKTKSDKDLFALEKQLHRLTLITDVEMFEPSSPEILELYQILEYLLTSTEAKSAVAGKVLTFYTHLSKSSFIKYILRDDLRIVPFLSMFLKNSKLSKDNLLKTLNLLSITSYGIKVTNLDGWIVELLPILAATVTERTVGDESLLLALQTMTNVCRSNPLVIEYLHRIPNNKKLLEVMSVMKNATMFIRLLVLEILFFTDSKMIDGIVSKNDIIDVIFTVAIDGFDEGHVSWLFLAADVFEEFSSVPSLEQIFKEYKNYSTNLQLLLGRMTSETSDILAEALLTFVYRLVMFNHQDIRSLHETIFSKVTEWIHYPRCADTALNIITELLTSVSTSIIPSTCMDNIVEAIKTCLSSKEDTKLSFTELQHITGILHLVDDFSSANEALRLKFAWKFEPNLFSNLMNKTIIYDSNWINRSQQQIMTSPNSTVTTKGSDSGVSSTSGVQIIQQEESGVGRCDLKFSKRKIISKAIILILGVTKTLSMVKSEHLAGYKKMMENPTIMKHLKWVTHSGSKECMNRAWTIISDGSLSKECLNALVSTTIESSDTNCHGFQRRSRQNETLSVDFEEKVDTLIARLRGTVIKKEIKDCPLTDVINMYEYRLASFAHSEKYLQEALMKADTQNRQAHLIYLQVNTQNDHLRNLLVKGEFRLQKVEEEKSSLLRSIEEIKESSRNFKENFISEKESLEKKINDMKKDLMAMKGSLNASEEKNDYLQQQLSNKMQELKSHQIQIQDEQEKGLKLMKQVHKLEEEVKHGSRTAEELKEEIKTLEDVKLQLNKENHDLELLVKSRDEALAAKEEEVEEITIKLNKMAEIQNMIRDISSREVIQ